MKVRTRFAPSPTGYLHIGGVRTALYAWLYAKKNGGDFILRIEDTDRERLVESACDRIYSTLKDCGLTYDEGPDVGGDFGPYIQSDRKDIYLKYAEQLVEQGDAYYCFCTKERLQELKDEAGKKGEVAKYDKHCSHIPLEEAKRRVAAGESYVIRQNIPTDGESSYDDMVYGTISVPMSDMEDNILIKSDGWPTYNLANVIDDHLMGITHVIRGIEYLSSTPKYNLLYDAFGWERPKYIHLPPVMKDKQHKLSKRNGDASYEDFIKKGYLKEAIINYIALLGWSPGGEQEIFSLSELAEAFDLDGISKSPSIFDNEKLTWMNAQYISRMDTDEFLERAKPYFDEALKGEFDRRFIAELLQPRLETLAQIPEKISFLSQMPDYDIELYTHKKMKTNPEISLPILEGLLPVMESQEDYSAAALHDAVMDYIKTTGEKNGKILWPLRIAITGTKVTPGGAFEAAALLGKDETLRRLRLSIDKLKSSIS